LYYFCDFTRSVLDSGSDAEDQHNSPDKDGGASTSNGTTLKTDTGSVESVPAVTSNDGSAPPTGGSTNAALTTDNPEVLSDTEIGNGSESSAAPGNSLTSTTPLNCIYFCIYRF
jgi:hypothetical protein